MGIYHFDIIIALQNAKHKKHLANLKEDSPNQIIFIGFNT